MTTIAFIEKEHGFAPCHIKDIKKSNVYYLVTDGARSEVRIATEDAIVDTSKDEGWRVEGVTYE